MPSSGVINILIKIALVYEEIKFQMVEISTLQYRVCVLKGADGIIEFQ